MPRPTRGKKVPDPFSLWRGSLLLLAWIPLVSCACVIIVDPPKGPDVKGEPDTRYYFLTGQFSFEATDFGTVPAAEACGGGPWWLPLEECEIKPEGLRRWPSAYVTTKYAQGRLAEVGLWYGGVVCRRYAFGYDISGRLASRRDTVYEPRPEGEDVDEWATRMRGRTRNVTSVREVAYTWSEDARRVTVKMLTWRGATAWVGLPEWPTMHYAKPGEVLETWELDDNGRIVAVLSGGAKRYSATYDKAGNLVRSSRGGHETVNYYDDRGRIVKAVVRNQRIGDKMVVLHEYPDARAPKARRVSDHGPCETFIRVHDRSGHIATVRVGETPGPSDPMLDFTLELKRDRKARVRWMTCVPTRAWFGLLTQVRQQRRFEKNLRRSA